jgi:hypothetical protein
MADVDGFNIDAPAGFPKWSQKGGKIGFEIPVDQPGSGGLTYRMRGYDTTLTQIVFWSSDHVDSTAADYSGPGPVIDIVVQDILGA